MGRVDNKVAFVTGGADGIGLVTCRLLAKEGAKVAIVDMNEEKGAAAVQSIKDAGGEAIFIRCNITIPEEVEFAVKETVRVFGKLDIQFNNAGKQGAMYDIAHMSVETLDEFINVNIRGTWLCMHYAAPELVKTKGSIINTASIAASLGSFGGTGYGMSKGAVISMTYAVANELGIYGVRCNAISPSMVLTDQIKKSFPAEMVELRKGGNVLHRIAEPIDIANTVLFLASDESASCTGLNLYIDCGSMIRSQPFVMQPFLDRNPYPMV